MGHACSASSKFRSLRIYYATPLAQISMRNALRSANERCRKFYAPKMGRPSLAPGMYFRLLLIGYFEGLDSERGIAWRAADSLALRSFLRIGLEEVPSDHSMISWTRRLLDVAAFNLSLILRRDAGAGTPRGLEDLRNRLFFTFCALWMLLKSTWERPGHQQELSPSDGTFYRPGGINKTVA